MKITTVILLIGCLQVCAKTYSQKISLRETNAPLAKVLDQIKQQSGFQLFYEDRLVASANPVTVNIHDANLADALDLIFRDQPLVFEIIGQTIAVKEKTESSQSAQNAGAFPLPPVDVHGHVADTLGNPLVGASISIKGQKTGGTLTDASGNFTLNNVDPKATLLISFIGYETRQYKLNGKNEISVLMRHASESMQEIVINKGYYTTTQRFNTGNVSVVKAEDIEKQPVTDPLLALKGLVPGLEITQASGVPGAYSTVQIRGQRNLTTGASLPVTANDPLYIIDGVPFSSQTLTSPYIGGGIVGGFSGYNNIQVVGEGLSPFNSINPHDIESIEVLKDGDATSIYGSRGANGVILITTKKGRSGPLKTDISVYSGVNRISREFHLLNTPQYLEMRREAISNDGFESLYHSNNPFLDQVAFPDLKVWDTTKYTNWQKILIDNPALFTDANVNLSGGSANTQVLVGAGLTTNGTTTPGNYKDERASLHFDVNNTSLDKRFGMELSTMYSYDNSDLPGNNLAQYITLAPDAPALYDANGNLNWEIFNGGSTFQNPMAYTKIRFNSVTELITGSLNLKYELLKNLHLSSRFGYNHSQMTSTNITPGTASQPPFDNFPESRQSSFANANATSWIIEPQASYKVNLLKGNLDLLIGSTFQSSGNGSRAQTGVGFSSDALLTNIMAASTATFVGASQLYYHYAGIFGRLGYNWGGKYLLNLTGRRDGSSRFGDKRQFGNFGAIGAGWIFSEEKWIADNLAFLSFGKLRGSYGVNGSDGIGDYQFLSTYSPTGLSYNNISGLSPNSLSNPYLQWQQTQKLEFGIELGLDKDKIHLGVSWYRDRTGNQLTNYPLPTITGYPGALENLPAVVQNKGWEFTFQSTNIQTKSFKWSTIANLSLHFNKLVSFPGLENSNFADVYKVGQSLNISYVPHYTGVNPQTGVFQFASKSGNGVFNFPDDYVYHDPPTPVSGYIGNTVSYKGLQLDFSFQLSFKEGVSYLSTLNSPPGARNANQPVEVLGRWQKPGDRSNIQRFTMGGNYAAANSQYVFQASDGKFTDASFARLNNVSLSYNFGSGWVGRSRLKNLRAYINCQNVLVITKYHGLDPEVQGISMPLMRTIVGGIQIGL